ncbi:MAG TPA: FHA domain-containing protein, partial [Candidatus Rifleibacterium sp.]|nr:FHA domain-containing protein [Candidatus Rifleibacterium sp.]
EPPRAATAPIEHKERLVFAIEGIGKAYEAQGGIIRIGRQSDNQICISASEVSRKHVEVTVSKGIVSVCPLTDTNVTRINGRTIKDKQTIKPGDTLNLGGTDFVVVKARAI